MVLANFIWVVRIAAITSDCKSDGRIDLRRFESSTTHYSFFIEYGGVKQRRPKVSTKCMAGERSFVRQHICEIVPFISCQVLHWKKGLRLNDNSARGR